MHHAVLWVPAMRALPLKYQTIHIGATATRTSRQSPKSTSRGASLRAKGATELMRFSAIFGHHDQPSSHSDDRSCRSYVSRCVVAGSGRPEHAVRGQGAETVRERDKERLHRL